MDVMRKLVNTIYDRIFDESNSQSISDLTNKVFNKEDEITNENIIEVLRALDGLNEDAYKDETTRQLLRWVSNSVFVVRTNENINEIINSGLLRVFRKFSEYYLKDGNWDDECIRHIFTALTSLIQYPDGVRETIDNSLVEYAINVLQIGNFHTIERLKNDVALNLYVAIIGFLDRITNNKDGKEKLSEVTIGKILLKHLDEINRNLAIRNELKYIKIFVLVTIASVLTEDEINELNISNDTVNTILDILRQAIENSKINEIEWQNTKYYFTYTINCNTSYSTAEDIVTAIVKISVNDVIKQKLLDFKVFNYVDELIRNGNDKEIECSCELVCSLCFSNTIRMYLKKHNQVIELINGVLEKTENILTERYCLQTIQMLNESNSDDSLSLPKKSHVDSRDTDNHIMITYNQKYKEKCCVINEELKKKGYTTWMNTQQALSDLYDAMTKAIENASIILVCYSEEYKESVNCRYEVNYASKLNKELIFVKVQASYIPDGWLAMAMVSKLHVDFTKGSNLKVPFNNLLRQIESIVDKSKKQTHRADDDYETAGECRKYRHVELWNSDEAKLWFETNRLLNIQKLFPNCSGITLKGLFEMKEKDYVQFTNSIDKHIEKAKIDVDLQEKVEFFELLQQLFTV